MPNILNIALQLMGFIETDEDDGESIVVSKTESRTTNNKKVISFVPKTSTPKPTIVHITPEAFDDVVDIAKRLQNKTIVTMNLASLDVALSQRIIDFARGAVYALDGGVMK